MSLSGIDYLVIGAYLVAITAFGSWFARYQKTTRDYFLTDRSVPWWAICFTIVATETSTLTFIGIPAQAYTGNMTFLQLAVGYIIGRLLVSILFIPAYFRGDLFTSYELLQRRFGTRVKTLSAVIFLITRSLADGIRLFTTALVIAIVTQVPVTWVVIVLGAAMIVYTMRGGVSAVIWTDVVQMFVYIAGAGAVAIALLGRINGGWAEVVARRRGDRPVRLPRSVARLYEGVHDLGRPARRGRADAVDARHRSIPGAAAAVGEDAAGCVDGPRAERLHRLCAVHPVPADRRHALHALSASAVAADAGASGSDPPDLRRQRAEERPGRLHRRGDRRGGVVAVARTRWRQRRSAISICPTSIRPPIKTTQMRVSKQATVSVGRGASSRSPIGAQFMNRSVLDAGLAVLSFASGSVLGAFLLGTLAPSVRERDTFAGMIAGLLVMTAVWWATPIAFTWYVLIGAVTTCTVALISRRLSPGAA